MSLDRELIYSNTEYYNRIRAFNAKYRGFLTMQEAYLPLMDSSQQGEKKEWSISQTINEKGRLLNEFARNLYASRVDLMQNVELLDSKHLCVEEITSRFAHTAYAYGEAFCLIGENDYEFQYTRVSDPETTAYMDFYNNELYWVGYKDKGRKQKHRATTMLALWLAEHNPETLTLEVLLPRKSILSNKMCQIYEAMNFEFDGISSYRSVEMFGASYHYKKTP